MAMEEGLIGMDITIPTLPTYMMKEREFLISFL